MSAYAVIRVLEQLGVTLTAYGDRLRLNDPTPILTQERLAWVKEHKAALLAELRLRHDPRPDLADDSVVWTRLLHLAHSWDGDDLQGLFGALHGLRCCGARLHWDGEKYLVRPSPGESWTDEASFQSDRERWLVPHCVALDRLLRALVEEHETLSWWLRVECGGIDTGGPANEMIEPESVSMMVDIGGRTGAVMGMSDNGENRPADTEGD